MRLERVCGVAVLLACLVLQCGEALQCQLYPVSYTFVNADVQRVAEPSCSIASTNYTVCSTPSRLTDSQLGPQHDPIDNSSYYIFQGSAQDDARYYILFTFDQTVDVYNITLHYFIYNQGDTQPIVTAFEVGDGVELGNIQQQDLASGGSVSIPRPSSLSRGLNSTSTQGAFLLIISREALLRIDFGGTGVGTTFFLSEVAFFTRPRPGTPCPEPPTTSSTPATTGPTTDPPTTEPPTTATGPTTDLPVTTAIAYTTDPVTTEPPTTATAVTTTRLPPAMPPASNETATGRPNSTVIAAGVTAALLVAIVVLVVTTAVAVGVVAYRRRRRRRGGKGAGFGMEQNQCYTTTTTHSKVTTPPSSGESVYDDIIIASNKENIYEPIPV